MSCFCGKELNQNEYACSLDHKLIFQYISDPIKFYKVSTSNAEQLSDVAWYQQNGKMYRLDIIFWNNHYKLTGKKLPVIIREFENGRDKEFHV